MLLAVAASACVVLAACGDDGTEGLSFCPEGKIVLDKMNVLRCAPMMNRAGSGATQSAVTGAATGASTGAAASKPSGSSAPSGASNGSGSSASGGASNGSSSGPSPSSSGSGSKPAANGGGSPSVPSGPWACFQTGDSCSCSMDPSGSVGNGCTKHPTCCAFVVAPDDKIYTCLCVPEDSAQCDGMRANPAMYPPIDKCPPS